MEIKVSGGHTPNHVASVFGGYEVGGTCVTFSTVMNSNVYTFDGLLVS